MKNAAASQKSEMGAKNAHFRFFFPQMRVSPEKV